MLEMADEKKFLKYPKILHLNETLEILDHPVEVYEKLDGGNSQIRNILGRVFAGSRSKFLTNPKYFSQPWFKKFQKWALSNSSMYNLPENFIIYGEWLSKHTLDYFPEFTDKFFMIDLFDLEKNRFVQYKDAKERLTELGVNDLLYLKSLIKGKINEKDLEHLIQSSDYRKGDREGLVIKNYDLQKFAKLWASSLRNRKISDFEIKRIIFSLKDSDEEVSEERVVEEAITEFKRIGRFFSDSDVKKKIFKFFLYHPLH